MIALLKSMSNLSRIRFSLLNHKLQNYSRPNLRTQYKLQKNLSDEEFTENEICKFFLQVQKERARTVKCKPLHDM